MKANTSSDTLNFDRNLHDVIQDGLHLVFIKSDHLQITLDQSLVDVEGLYGYWDRDYDPTEKRWVDVFVDTYPDQHQLAAFMEANATACVLHVDQGKKHMYIDEIEEAERLGMRVTTEPEVTVNSFFDILQAIAA